MSCTSPSSDRSLPSSDRSFPDNVLLWSPEQRLRGFRSYDRIFPTRTISTGTRHLELPRVASNEVAGVRYELEGKTFDLDAFQERTRAAGILVIHRGAIVLERHWLGHGPEIRWACFSIAKSVVSLLVGAAIRDGHIGGVEDTIPDYLPILAGSAYEGVTLRHALQMSSGVDWSEGYADAKSDVRHDSGRTSEERLRYLGSRKRVAAPGERFNYSSGEAYLLGEVVAAAVGSSLSSYLAAKIWRPFGMEFGAHWMLVEPDGMEHGGSGVSATLGDCGRLGLFALAGGILPDGSRMLPDGWMDDSTAPSPANSSYGYLWWRRGYETFAASGIFGQAIVIDPAYELVLVTHSAWPEPTALAMHAHRDALLASLRHVLSG